MMNFCTLFDSNYVSKGLALYLSIKQHTDDFVLYVMAMDLKCEEILNTLNLNNVVIDNIEDSMTPELSEAKSNRSRAEFCWTCGSFTTHHFLTKYSLNDITYLDSDLMFFTSPQVIFDELESSGASVGLSPHYIPYNATGEFCVQYCYFKNDSAGLSALTWWKNECLKWCYSQIEDGKYGDQMYLDYMPQKFDNVHSIKNRGAGMAYWNEFAYHYFDKYLVYSGVAYPYVFFHYSGFNIKWQENKIVIKECYCVSDRLRQYLIKPYITLMSTVYEEYLNMKVESIEYVKDYGLSKVIVSHIFKLLSNFDTWHKLKGYLLKRKYTKRISPYSEKKEQNEI